MKKYDVIVIGSGAGNIIQEEALQQGLTVAQIERGKLGGTCLTRGCIPTKVMTTLADRLIEFEESKEIGLTYSDVKLDWDQVTDRVWQKIDESKILEDMFFKTKNLDLYQGTASFVEDKVIEIALNNGEGTKRITADRIFIGTGGRTNVPPVDGLEETGYLTTESFFGDSFPKKPYKSLIVIGGGAIGVEFAHIFAALGTKVHIIQRNVRLLPKEDEEVSELLLSKFLQRGINVHFNVLTTQVKKEGNKKILTIKDKTTGEEKEVIADEILVAPGIQSTSDLLKLDNTHIKTDEKGWIMTNEFLETTVDGVWAFGDINGRQQFRHKANYEADIISYNNFMNKKPEEYRWARYDLVPAVTYTYPQVAHVGMTVKEALEKGHQIKVGKQYYSETAKGFAIGYNKETHHDFAKIIIDKDTKEILGFHAIGAEAAMMIQPFVNLMNAGETPLVAINEEIGSETTKKLRKQGLVRQMDPRRLNTVRETMVPHPSLSEVGIWTFYDMRDYKEEE